MSDSSRSFHCFGARLLLGAAATAIAVSQAGAADGKAFVEVGQIPLDCPITIKTNRSFRLPSDWTVSPQKAVEIAAAAGEARCASKLQQAVFADAESYYIVKTVLGPMSETSPAIRVNGVTGALSVRN